VVWLHILLGHSWCVSVALFGMRIITVQQTYTNYDLIIYAATPPKCFDYFYLFISISSSIDPLQGQRLTGCGSSHGTFNSCRDYYWILGVKVTLKYTVLDLKLEYTVAIHWVSALLRRSVWLRLILVQILVQGFLGLQIL
jgi:hypothetical protein